MAIITVSSGVMADLSTAITNAVGGDIIKVSGTYAGVMNKTSGTTKASEVIIESASYASPAVINGTIRLQGSPRFLTFRWLNFIGTVTENTRNGIAYPGADEPLRFDGGRDMKVKSCLFRYWRNGLKFQSCSTGPAEVSYCNFEQICVDPLMVYGVMDGFWEHHNAFVDWRIDPVLRSVSNRHPDANHVRPNTSQVGSNPMADALIESNLIDDTSGYAKGLFFNNEAGTVGTGFTGLIVRKNHIKIGRYAGIEVTGAPGLDINGNLVQQYSAGVGEVPRIIIQMAVSSGSITNNVVPPTSKPPISYEDGASASNFTDTTNVESTSATPAGWTPLVLGVNVGRIPDTGTVEPDQPVTEWSDAPTNSVSKDGRIAAYYALGTTPERYGPVLVIPPTSVAWSVVSTLPTVPGADVSNTIRAIWPAVYTPRRVRVADPATSGGNRRYEIYGDAGDDASVYSVLADGVFSGITWGYSNGEWSDYSAYPGGFTAPAAPPPATLDPLADGDWGYINTPYAVLPGRFTNAVTVSSGIGWDAVQWTPDGGDGIWRGVVQTGTQEGEAVLQLQPAVVGGTEHTVGYEGTLTIRLRYSIAGAFSPQSVSAETFTGPDNPTVNPYVTGDFLTLGGPFATLAGFCVTIPGANHPATPSGYIRVLDTDGTISITHEGGLPPTSVGSAVFYDGIRYEMTLGTVEFTRTTADEGFLGAYDSRGAGSPLRRFELPFDSSGAPSADFGDTENSQYIPLLLEDT